MEGGEEEKRVRNGGRRVGMKGGGCGGREMGGDEGRRVWWEGGLG